MKIHIMSFILGSMFLAAQVSIDKWDMPFPDSSGVRAAIFNATGDKIAVASRNEVVVYDVQSKSKTHSFVGHSAEITALSFHPHGTIVASGSRDRTIKIWSLVTNKQIGSLAGHGGTVTCLCFSPDGEVIASGSTDSTVKLWSISGEKQLMSVREHNSEITEVSFNSDGTTLITRSQDQALRIWNTKINTVNLSSGVKSSMYYYTQGLNYKNRGLLDKAVAEFDKCVEMDSNFADAYYQLACVYSLKTDVNRGLASLEKSLQAGYSNLDGIKSDQELSLLRADSRFAKLLDTKQNGTSETSETRTSFYVVNSKTGETAPTYDVLIDGKNVSEYKDFTSGEYEFTIRFKNFKTVQKRIYFTANQGPVKLSMDLQELNKYQFFTRGDSEEIDGISYEYTVYVDSQPIEPHLLSKEQRGGFTYYTFYAPYNATDFEIYAGYRYNKERIQRVSGAIKRLDLISIPMLIRHLGQVVNNSNGRPITGIKVLETLLKSPFWNRRFKKIPPLEILPLIEYVEKWEFPESYEDERRMLLLDLLRGLMDGH